MPDLARTCILVSGVCCEAEARLVDPALRAVSGVEGADVDLVGRKAWIRHSATLSPGDLLDALRPASRSLPCSASSVCPNPRMLMWWMETTFGVWATNTLGLEASSLCMGLCLALVAGAGAAIVVSVRAAGRPSIFVPAFLLFLAIWPSVIVQSMGESATTLASWSVGLAIGAGFGVAAGTITRRLVARGLSARV